MSYTATQKRQTDLMLALINAAQEIEAKYMDDTLDLESAVKRARAAYEALWWAHLPNEAYEACASNQRNNCATQAAPEIKPED